MSAVTVYIASSFKHKHGVRLLGMRLRDMGFTILDWTEKATPPAGLTSAERRIWMDTDMEGGQVFSFCYEACTQAQVLLYFGESGQDAAVEVGLAAGAGVPVLGIRGPLESPGLMLHGVAAVWVEQIEEALHLMQQVGNHAQSQGALLEHEQDPRVRALCRKIFAREAVS